MNPPRSPVHSRLSRVGGQRNPAHPAGLLATLLGASVLLGACAAVPVHRVGEAKTPAQQAPEGASTNDRLLAEGVRLMLAGDLPRASTVANAGLKLTQQDWRLHALNGLGYHMQWLDGDSSRLELAETAYRMALAIEPSAFVSALQLGRLYFEARHYERAIAAFELAADIDASSLDAHLGLAGAAYFARKPGLARSALASATALAASDARVHWTGGLVAAAGGDDKGARIHRQAFFEASGDSAAARRLDDRLGRWRDWHSAAGLDEAANNVAQATPPTPASAPANPGSDAPPVAPSRPGEPMAPRWHDCDVPASQAAGGAAGYAGYAGAGAAGWAGGSGYAGAGGYPGASAGMGAGGSSDETAQLQALPMPCKATGIPRMAVIDVVVLRTEEATGTAIGMNLLSGLSLVLNRAIAKVDTLTQLSGAPDSRTITTTRSSGIATPQAGLAYSLNIANALGTSAEVIARPSIVAMDRQPSTFFSGRNVTLAIAGSLGGAGNLADRSVGVSLSVVPTFVNDDTLLLAVKAARSFIEPLNPSVGFSQSLQTSRNSVSANVTMKFDQTLILSGLSEQEIIRVTDGVPVLQDIPILQHLFRQRSDQTYTRQVLIMLTPRRPLAGAELESAIERVAPRASTPQAATTPQSNQHHLLATQRRLLLQYRSTDIEPDRWHTGVRLQRLLSDLARYAYN